MVERDIGDRHLYCRGCSTSISGTRRNADVEWHDGEARHSSCGHVLVTPGPGGWVVELRSTCRNCGKRLEGRRQVRWCSSICSRAYLRPHQLWKKLCEDQSYLCGICCLPLPTFNGWLPDERTRRIQVDHVVPKAKGGSRRYENLRATHSKCNLMKGINTLAEVRSALGLSDEVLAERVSSVPEKARAKLIA